MDTFVTLLIRILEIMFVVGICGSVTVWLLTAVDLISVVATADDSNPAETPAGESNAV